MCMVVTLVLAVVGRGCLGMAASLAPHFRVTLCCWELNMRPLK